jgi:cathepsin L
MKKGISKPLVIPQDKLPILSLPKYKGENLTWTSFDWVQWGGVNTPMNQGSCGSCWSFAATGTLETAYYTKYYSLPKFSEQMLISCDTIDNGCNGAENLDDAIEWVQSNGGIATESAYPYASASNIVPACDTSITVSSKSAPNYIYNVSPSMDVDAMKTYVGYNTVSVAIEADQSSFQYYSSGVITGTENCGTNLDHAVLNVGFGSLNGIDYWKGK